MENKYISLLRSCNYFCVAHKQLLQLFLKFFYNCFIFISLSFHIGDIICDDIVCISIKSYGKIRYKTSKI